MGKGIINKAHIYKVDCRVASVAAQSTGAHLFAAMPMLSALDIVEARGLPGAGGMMIAHNAHARAGSALMLPRQSPMTMLAEECRRVVEKEVSARVEEFEQDLMRNLHEETSSASDQADESAGSGSTDDSILQRYFAGDCSIVGHTIRSRYAACCQ